MSKAAIALGSNVGDRFFFLKKAVGSIKALGKVTAISPIYETSPYGFTEQPDFLNAVILLNTRLSAEALLSELKKIEKEVGRMERIRWGPREIDLDIILYDELEIDTADLTVPHPDFQNRIFVLRPLLDIAPDLMNPRSGQTIREILTNCQDKTIIKLIEKEWYSDGAKV
jgi:2-amino-4-hydroxy-6-hydroxymethyldihydropteridine diphosphokinase